MRVWEQLLRWTDRALPHTAGKRVGYGLAMAGSLLIGLLFGLPWGLFGAAATLVTRLIDVRRATRRRPNPGAVRGYFFEGDGEGRR